MIDPRVRALYYMHLLGQSRVFSPARSVDPEAYGYFLGAAANAYRNLRFALKFRYLVMLGLTLVFLFTVGLIATKQLKFLLFAGDGIEYFWIRAEAEKGTPIAKTAAMLKPIEDEIAKLAKVRRVIFFLSINCPRCYLIFIKYGLYFYKNLEDVHKKLRKIQCITKQSPTI